MSYTTNISDFRGLGDVMSQLTDIENHKASGADEDLLCTKLSCVSQRDSTFDQYEPEPEQYLDYYNELNCDNNEKFVAPGYPDSSLSDEEINAALVKKANLGCSSDETGIGSRSDTSAADTSNIPEKEGPMIATALNYFQYQLKGISFLPKLELGAYKQMPYEEITEKKYNKMVDELSFLSFRQVKGNEAEVDKFCNNDTCEIDFNEIKETQEVE